MNDNTLARAERGGAQEVRGISRRTLARGTAWTAPIVIVGVAAPTYAASGPCLTGQSSPATRTTPISTLTFPPSAVTGSVTFSSTGAAGNDQTPGDTGEVHTVPFSPAWNYIKLHHPQGMTQGDTITMTLLLSQPVTNLSLTITDIDKIVGDWIDEVVVTPPGFTAVKAANVIGSGTAGDPFRSSVNGGISSAAGDVRLTWAGPLTQVQITYRAADADNESGIGQHVGVGKIGFVC